MSFMELAQLVDKRAEESRLRDEKMLEVISSHETQIQVQRTRLDTLAQNVADDRVAHSKRFHEIDERCKAHSEESSADKTSRIVALQQSQSHWLRYTVAVAVTLILAVIGGIVGTAYAQRAQLGVVPSQVK